MKVNYASRYLTVWVLNLHKRPMQEHWTEAQNSRSEKTVFLYITELSGFELTQLWKQKGPKVKSKIRSSKLSSRPDIYH